MCKKIYWPESQTCIGCKHGNFLMNEQESSVYICDNGLSNPTEDCHEPSVSNLSDLEIDDLKEKEEIFYERKEKGLPIDLEDFNKLKIEMERKGI